ncbi:MAG: adenylate synthase [Candidatus Dactylopiibacterium carminicum]|nr:MAG: adenylate synthase [Candidatus Dactylopiibacterium carminicum]
MNADVLIMAAHFAHTRWRLAFDDRQKLEDWQQARLQRFLRETLPRASAFRHAGYERLSDLPMMDKASMMAAFDAYNTRGILLDEALPIAMQAERSRDFEPTLGQGSRALTVGLSSGTSGNRGVFLVSKAERLRIAFFLRANSNLYTTLNSRRIDFAFHDLLEGIEPALPRLNANRPDVLVGPPSLLRALATEAAAGRLHIQPAHIISVAEVLEDDDRGAIQASFGQAPHQLYQATEGLLGYTCEHGCVHLNESFVHIEPDWLDEARTRFQPIVTDFTRQTQLIVRYRLNDVLRVCDAPCPCGRAERAIAAIEGRSDEVLWLPALADGRATPVFPDFLRRAMLFAGTTVREYRIVQAGMRLDIALQIPGDRPQAIQRVSHELAGLWQALGLQAPALNFNDWQAPAAGVKRRRVERRQVPPGLACTF